MSACNTRCYRRRPPSRTNPNFPWTDLLIFRSAKNTLRRLQKCLTATITVYQIRFLNYCKLKSAIRTAYYVVLTSIIFWNSWQLFSHWSTALSTSTTMSVPPLHFSRPRDRNTSTCTSIVSHYFSLTWCSALIVADAEVISYQRMSISRVIISLWNW